MGDISEHFSFSEFRCGCGCNRQDIKIELVDKLQMVRTMYDKPMRITSGFRCRKFNGNIGAKDTSSHVDGEAADIHCDNSSDRDLLVGLLRSQFTRMGIDRNFIHVDISKKKDSPVLWVY
jgi:uncharacterized protein YcbK (DUF882 family)